MEDKNPDGGKFYFTRTYIAPRRHTIMVTRWNSYGWSKPEIANFLGKHSDGEPNFSPDGEYLFFSRACDIYWVDANILEILRIKTLGDSN